MFDKITPLGGEKHKGGERMKKIFAILVAFFVFCSSAVVWAEEVAEKSDEKTFSLSGEIRIFTPYVSEYTGEKISNGAVVQPSITLTHNSTGLYVSALGYILRKGVDEYALCFGKSTPLGGVTLDTGIGINDVRKLGIIDGDFFIIYAGADFPEVIGIIPFVYIEGNVPFKKEFAEGGVFWKLGARNKKPVEIAKQPFDFKIEAGGNDGIYGSDSKLLSFARGTASTEVKLFGLKLSPSIAVQKGFGGIAGQEWRAIAGLTFLF